MRPPLHPGTQAAAAHQTPLLRRSNPVGIIAFVVALLAFLFLAYPAASFWLAFLSLPLSIAGMILGFKIRSQAEIYPLEGLKSSFGLSLSAMIIGIIMLFMSAFFALIGSVKA